MSEGISISAATIKGWEKEEAMLVAGITNQQERLARVRKKLEAAALLSAETAPKTISINFSDEAAIKVNGNGKVAPKNMTEVIEELVNSSTVPVPKKTLRSELARRGFTDEQLGPYFYTVIMRLKNKERISVMPDGNLWKTI